MRVRVVLVFSQEKVSDVGWVKLVLSLSNGRSEPIINFMISFRNKCVGRLSYYGNTKCSG